MKETRQSNKIFFREMEWKNMNYTYFGDRIERSSLGNLGLQLLESQEKLVSQEWNWES